MTRGCCPGWAHCMPSEQPRSACLPAPAGLLFPLLAWLPACHGCYCYAAAVCRAHVSLLLQNVDPCACHAITELLCIAYVCRMGDEAEALACYSEAFASDRANLDCVSWLGAHHVRRQDYLAAVPYFEAAGRVQPREASAATSCWLAGWVEAAFAAAPVIGALLPLRWSCEKRLLPLLRRGAWGYAFAGRCPGSLLPRTPCQIF